MDSAAIEQMNKLRKSLGLPLLGGTDGPSFKPKTDDDASDEEPASTLETREAAGHENFKKLQEEQKRKLEREQRKKAIQRARDKAARFQKLEGVGLGDDCPDDQDTTAWLKGQKKRQKEIEKERARKLEEELAERERLAAVEYTSADLAGVQVAHEVDDFEDGNGQILTLKDQEIGKDDDDDEGDILQNAEILARDALREKLEAKKRIRYDIHDDEKQELLSQYDEKKRKAFTLDAQGSSIDDKDSKRQAVSEKLKNVISLDSILKPELTSDYQEIKIKKPKKSTKKHRREKEADEDDTFASNANGNGMDVDAPRPRSKVETNFADDEDLASALAFNRRTALKKKKLKPEDLVRQLKEETPIDDLPDAAEAEGRLTFDDTTAFLDNLQSRADNDDKPTKKIEPSPSTEQLEKGIDHSDEDLPMQEAGEAYAIVEGDEQALLDNIQREQSSTPAVEHSRTGLAEEQTLNTGVGAALNLLRSRGIVQDSNMGEKNTLYRDRQKFIHEQRLREYEEEQRAKAQRERDRTTGRNVGMSQREREEKARRQNEARAQHQSIAAAAAFNREYKPDVELKYFDDNGRQLNQKEAFKNLSHQFHGKGSGKGKTEKHLKKLEDEKRQMAKSVLDSSTDDHGMKRAQGTMGKRDKVAGIRLA